VDVEYPKRPNSPLTSKVAQVLPPIARDLLDALELEHDPSTLDAVGQPLARAFMEGTAVGATETVAQSAETAPRSTCIGWAAQSGPDGRRQESNPRSVFPRPARHPRSAESLLMKLPDQRPRRFRGLYCDPRSQLTQVPQSPRDTWVASDAGFIRPQGERGFSRWRRHPFARSLRREW
jgi:hypothetical protein